MQASFIPQCLRCNQLHKVDATKQNKHMRLIKRQRRTSKVTLNVVANICSSGQLSQRAIKDQVLLHCKAQNIITEPDQLSYV